eukprot:CAMPEP_0119014660 /NCGR_PEP_ID=MMETSP1176-20130426/10134_1 /TAXON_ID=265551 /ORGANISM="Synedropsis recta cf, Strain CCMP1620" /LENGTH=210 /DNA_ID=CAMNT_0006967873 /DNA_START=42 /DNA_END=674 /DNA_ORIENTATION=+
MQSSVAALLLLLVAFLGNPTAAVFPRYPRGARTAISKEKQNARRSLKRSKGSREDCQELQAVLLGENLFKPEFVAFTQTTIVPQPLDKVLFNLPLYDPTDFLYDGTLTVIGAVRESITYVPPQAEGEEEPNSIGDAVWTIDGLGQFSDRFSTPVQFDQSIIISGGLGAFECAQGYGEVLDVTDDFSDGGGFILWNIVMCNTCADREHYDD